MIINLSDVVRQVQGGELRLLGFADGLGSLLFPNAAFIKATGPGNEISGWFGFCGPRGMPAQALTRWQNPTDQALQDLTLQRSLLNDALRFRFEDAAAFCRALQPNHLVWRETIHPSNHHAA
jgi:tripartite-type tricarboxylate transporter receptor subunit TctC